MTNDYPPSTAYDIDHLLQRTKNVKYQVIKRHKNARVKSVSRRPDISRSLEIEPILRSGDVALSAALLDICDVLAEFHRELCRLRTRQSQDGVPSLRGKTIPAIEDALQRST